MANKVAAKALDLIEDPETGNRFVVYTTKTGVHMDVHFDGEEPWFTQLQIAQIFGVSVPTVSEHIAKFRADGELDEATIRNFRIVRQEGERTVNREIEHYGLDVAFYVGYRVNSTEGKLFRRWATQMLVQLAKYGFVILISVSPSRQQALPVLLQRVQRHAGSYPSELGTDSPMSPSHPSFK